MHLQSKQIISCTFGVFFIISAATLPAQPLEVVVRKPGVEEDPSLVIQSFDGPEEIERLLQQTLVRCGWFRVRESGPADYQLQAAWRGDNERGRLRLAVGSGNQTAVDFTTRQPAAARQTVYEAVDTLLNQLFDVPGIASSRIAFVMGDNEHKEIYTMNFDGSQVRRITRNNSISTEPSWGGRGNERLFYTYYEPTRMSIMQAEPGLGRQRRIARFSGLNSGASVSPDMNRLAMSLSRDGGVNLYVMDLTNNETQQLTRDRAVISSPAWAPDGNNICYVSDRAGRPHLYMMNLHDGSASRLLRDYEEAVEPDWCPVSNQIAFSTQIGGRYVVAVIDLEEDSINRRIVTEGKGDWQSPAWAPDGRHLVCTHTLNGESRLVMIDTWMGDTTPITRPGKVELPDWSELTNSNQ